MTTEPAAPAETVVVDPALTAARANVVDAVDWESRVRAQSERADAAEKLAEKLARDLTAAKKAIGADDLRCVHCGNTDFEPLPG